MTVSAEMVRTQDLKVHFPIRGGLLGGKTSHTVKAVDGVNLSIAKGQILGLVGESGCGKSTLGRAIMRLIEPTSGSVSIDGIDFLALEPEQLRLKRPIVQMIFQDPYASLDPRMTVFDILAEPILTHGKLSSADVSAKIKKYLQLCGLSWKASKKYPHEFSGGQRQRVAIARALILEPRVVIADEPTSALDVSVQAQILNLLKEIQQELNLSMLFISHNLAVVRYIADTIAVMYLGKVVELADSESLYTEPTHPYSQALISAVPIPEPQQERNRKRIILKGEPPSPMNPPSGCAFHPRCALATEHCRQAVPFLEPANSSTTTHLVSCFEKEKSAAIRIS